MNIRLITTDEELYEKALILRYEIFFKEYDLPESIVQDEIESKSIHIAITDSNTLVAYARLTDMGGNEYKISQVVVEPGFQSMGYGKNLLIKTIEIAKSTGAKSIQLNSKLSATKIYSGLGFKVVGNSYASKTTNVPHVKMVLSPIT